MASVTSVRAYVDQLVKVAGKGKITVEYALHTGRMKLGCQTCDVTMTTYEPSSSDKIDYSIQNFLSIHGHNGGHNDTKVIKTGIGKAVTLDFKNVPFVPLPSAAQEICDAAKAANMIDDNYGKALKIENQMSAYDKEMAEKMSPENLAKKIALLQQADYTGELQKGLATLKEKGILDPATQQVTNETIADKKAELQALQNILILKNMQKKKEQLLGAISGEHAMPVPQPTKKIEKPLKIATGRKFR